MQAEATSVARFRHSYCLLLWSEGVCCTLRFKPHAHVEKREK